MGDEVKVPEIGVGMLGYAFMGRAHSNAYKKLAYVCDPPVAVPRLVAICGRDEVAVAQVARRYGYDNHYADWRRMLEDERVQLFDNAGPNHLHAGPSIAAARMGKHILCEKPLARNADEARAMLEAVQEAGIKHMVGFNYRFVPAVRLARDLIAAGRLGRIYHYRAVYLHEGNLPHHGKPLTWRTERASAGSGALGDLGSHAVDLARFLVGEIASVSALTRTFIPERPLPGGGSGRVDVDDAFVAALAFENGAVGTLEASRVAAGRKNHLFFEVNGELGSLHFNLERLNELGVYWVDEEPGRTAGFHNVLVTEADHPWSEYGWPRGHIAGWEQTFVHELAHLLDCIVNDRDVAPDGATFEDGYRAAVVSDAILASAAGGRQVDVQF